MKEDDEEGVMMIVALVLPVRRSSLFLVLTQLVYPVRPFFLCFYLPCGSYMQTVLCCPCIGVYG